MIERTPIYRAECSEWEEGCDPFFYEMHMVHDGYNTWIEIVCPHGTVKKFPSVSEAESLMCQLVDEMEDDD